jgi:hypothetical protein
MDCKGIATIDFIFAIFLTLIIAIICFNFIGNSLENQETLEKDLNTRTLIDEVANSINRVNSNSLGHIQKIAIPNIPSKGFSKSFYILISSNEVVFVSNDKKAESSIFPAKLANINSDIVEEIRLYPGESYNIKKSLDKNNMTVIQIYKLN